MKFSVFKLLFLPVFFVHCFCTFGQGNTHSVYHIVKNGENVNQISLRYSVPVDSLRRWNNPGHDDTFSVGQQIIVSKGKASFTAGQSTQDNGSIQIRDTSGTPPMAQSSDSLLTAAQNNFLPLYSEPVEKNERLTFFDTLRYYYNKANLLFGVIIVLNLLFVLSVLIIFAVLYFRRLSDGNEEFKRKECQDRYRDFITDWLYSEHNGQVTESFKKELKDKVYRDVFTSELLSLHTNLTGESADKLIGLFHAAGLKQYTILKVHHSRWHVKAKGIRELAQMKIKEENDLISTYLNSTNAILRIEAQLAWIQLNPDDPLSFYDDPDIQLTEWGLLNSLLSLKKIDAIPDFGRWLNSPNKSVTLCAIKMSGIFKQFANVDMVTQRLHATDRDIRFEAIAALGKMALTSPVPELKQLYATEELVNKSEIISALIMISDSMNIPFFEAVLLNETDLTLRIHAAKGLVSLDDIGKERLTLLYEEADPVLKKIIIHAKDDRI